MSASAQPSILCLLRFRNVWLLDQPDSADRIERRRLSRLLRRARTVRVFPDAGGGPRQNRVGGCIRADAEAGSHRNAEHQSRDESFPPRWYRPAPRSIREEVEHCPASTRLARSGANLGAGPAAFTAALQVSD